jgi:hypothetical protein
MGRSENVPHRAPLRRQAKNVVIWNGSPETSLKANSFRTTLGEENAAVASPRTAIREPSGVRLGLLPTGRWLCGPDMMEVFEN